MNLKEVFNEDFINQLGIELYKVDSNFNQKAFIKTTFTANWQNKELKERMHFITNKMHEFLPFDYTKQIQILKKVAPKFSGIQGFVGS